MSLYYEAAELLSNANNVGGSLKSRVFGSKNLKNPPAKIYALLAESTKWSSVLKEVIERADILRLERKLNPVLALLLVHDLLLTRKGVAAPANHSLNLVISKHKSRLAAELTRFRIRRKFIDLDELRKFVENGTTGPRNHDQNGDEADSVKVQHPRWIRVNAIKSSLQDELCSTFANFTETNNPPGRMDATVQERVYRLDENIPDLLALRKHIDITSSIAYKQGRLIIQDKASCFPAYLLDPASITGDIIDACAAPGNKTTHLAALLHSSSVTATDLDAKKKQQQRHIFAFERDKSRSRILSTMVKTSGADHLIDVKANTDFLSSDPLDPMFENVGALLLDPSCSGSGIVGRDDGPQLFLPEVNPLNGADLVGQQSKGSKKRKRWQKSEAHSLAATAGEQDGTEEQASLVSDDATLQTRLETLAAFQLKLLTHAMAFPAAQRITYSTCSIHATENEVVILKALASQIARERDWQILRRDDQVEGLRKWNVRGDRDEALKFLGSSAGQSLGLTKDFVEEVVKGCIRCEKGTIEGTMGFFVAALIRNVHPASEASAIADGGEVQDTVITESERVDTNGSDEDTEEWTGFSD